MVKIPVKTPKDNNIHTDIPVEEQTIPVDETPQPEMPEPINDPTASTGDLPEPVDAPIPGERVQEGLEPQETPDSETDKADATEEIVGDQEPEEAEELDELTILTRKLQAKEQEAAEHYDARLRLQAEFDNFKKRKEKEIADFRKYATSSLLEDILPVMDDFERAIAAAEQTHKLEDFLRGIEMIFTKFLDTLQKKGVKEIEAAPGQPFNPVMHEAVTQIETNDIAEGAIAAVFNKGYYLHDRVLRAPKVAVAKPKN